MSEKKFLDVVREYHEPLEPTLNKTLIEKSFHILSEAPHPTLYRCIRWIAETAFWTVSTMILAWFGYMAMDRAPPVNFEGRHIAAEQVVSGGKIGITATRTRLRSCYLKREISIRDSRGYVHEIVDDWESYGKADGIPKTETLELRLSTDLPDGPATMDVALLYSCNPLQRAFHWPIHLQMETLHFTVVPRN